MYLNVLAPEQEYNSQILTSKSGKDWVDELDPGQHEKTVCYKKMASTP